MNHPHMPISPLPPFFDLPPLLQKTTGTDHAGASSDEPAQKISKRPKTGRLTCRLRKKRCDEQKPKCATCERLGIECMGYSKIQPDGLKTEEEKLRAKQELKRKIRSNRSSRVGAGKDDDDAEADDGMDSYGPSRRDPTAFDPLLANPFETPGVAGDAAVWDDAIPEIPRPTDTGAMGMLGGSNDFMNPFAAYDDPGTGFEEVWNLIFGQQPPGIDSTAGSGVSGTHGEGLDNGGAGVYNYNTTTTTTDTHQLFLQANDDSADTSLLALFSPPSGPVLPAHSSLPPELPFPVPDLTYLHHYLNVVLPLQYRFVVRAMADLVAPLALSNPDVLKSTSSLAALHLAASKAKRTPALPWETSAGAGPRLEEGEKNVAMTMHRDTIERLRFVTPEELTTEGVVLPALFALSYYLFLGGTSRDWGDVLGISRRCLSAAFTASPEITGGPGFRLGSSSTKGSGSGGGGGSVKPSPWKRYRPLMCAMVWMDIVGSVSQNKVTRLLPIYRTVLAQAPSGWNGGEKRERLRMDKVVGCDDTTFLAIAETVALSEWRDGAEDAGCLSLKELLHRAGAIEKILDERSWREDTMALRGSQDGTSENGEANPNDMDAAIVPVMSEIFYGSAKVLLATVIHGPYPRVPEVAAAVQETAEALHRLDTLYPVADVNRALIFPITIAGCHCDTLAQQAFFRNRFAGLGAEAEAFGNSKQAMMLLEEVWRRRQEGAKRVEWRKVMRDLGWESGILLI